MARVTVEDCVTRVPNRFELVLFAAHRARGMSAGEEILVERDNDKNPVVALREIADTKLKPADVREELVESLQKGADTDDIDEPLDLPALTAPQPTARDVFGDTPASSPEKDLEKMDEDDILAALNAMGGADDEAEKDSDSE